MTVTLLKLLKENYTSKRCLRIMPKERWPNLFIVGAPRAGTTSLYGYLNEIPQIFTSSEKEPNFFNPYTVTDKGTTFIQPIRDEYTYLKLFENAKDENYLCEATTHYLFDPESPKSIHNVCPKAKIIITLRDPVEREYSQFKLIFQRTRVEKLDYDLSFLKEIKKQMKDKNNSWEPGLRLETGLYTENIKRYLETFGKENVKILIFEDWTNNTQSMMKEILQFLKINNNIENFHGEVHHKSKNLKVPTGNTSSYLLQTGYNSKMINKLIPQSILYFIRDNFLTKKGLYPELDSHSRKILINFYQDDVKNLERLLGKKLPWKNFHYSK